MSEEKHLAIPTLAIKSLIDASYLLDPKGGLLHIFKDQTAEQENTMLLIETFRHGHIYVERIDLIAERDESVARQVKYVFRCESIGQVQLEDFSKLTTLDRKSFEVTIKDIEKLHQKMHEKKVGFFLKTVKEKLKEFEKLLRVSDLKTLLSKEKKWTTVTQFNLRKSNKMLIAIKASQTFFKCPPMARWVDNLEANQKTEVGYQLLNEEKFAQALDEFDAVLESTPDHKKAKKGKFIALIALATNYYNRAEESEKSDDFSLATKLYIKAKNRFRQARKLFISDKEKTPDKRYADDCYELAQKRLFDIKSQLSAQATSSAPLLETSEEKKVLEFENLVFQGGGIKGLAYVGALEELIQSYQFDLTKVKRIAGTSAGAIITLGLGLGYSLSEIQELLEICDFTKLFDNDYQEKFLALNHSKARLKAKMKQLQESSGVSQASKGASLYSSDADVAVLKEGLRGLKEQDYGLFAANNFRAWIELLICEKIGERNATFADLHRHKKGNSAKGIKDIYLIGVDLTANKVKIFSYKDTPNAIISDAVRISMSIPLVFKAHRMFIKEDGVVKEAVDEHWYVDGGVLSNFPMWLFDAPNNDPRQFGYNEKTLGLSLSSPVKKGYYEGWEEKPMRAQPDSLMSFLFQLINTIYENRERRLPNLDNTQRTIFIDNQGVKTTKFDLSALEKDLLLLSGRKGVQHYFARLEGTIADANNDLQPNSSEASSSQVNRRKGDEPVEIPPSSLTP